ncbi:MAG: DUF4172 domain-containing protein [Bacteroidales bacterium]|nr:DUF4172 domain-containing protein [Bacteroidales bacterium]
MEYIWQQKDFPNFRYKKEKILLFIQDFSLLFGETNGLLQSLTDEEKQESYAHIMLSEAMKTSEIEGEYFSREDVMSSLKLNLGLEPYLQPMKNKKAESIAKLMIEVRKNYMQPLSFSMLLNWHKMLMEKEVGINAGQIRAGSEPMQVISGRYGDIDVHYQAPPSNELNGLLDQFIQWYSDFQVTELGKVGQSMLLSALSHLYFETLHPFEDGNGRIGRALAEKALAEKIEIPVFISLSKCIERNKKRYYEEIKKAQRNLEVTDWVVYFCHLIMEAQEDARQTVLFTVKKTKFFDKFSDLLNERETKAIQKMMEYFTDGFEGGMTARKYISINNTTKATATRDLQHLTEINIFQRKGAGRGISYELNI